MILIRYPASESNLQVRSRKHMESQDEKPKSKYGTGVRAWSELRRKLCKYFCIPSNEAVCTQKANGLDVEITDLTAVQTLSVPCPTCAAAPRERCCEIVRPFVVCRRTRSFITSAQARYRCASRCLSAVGYGVPGETQTPNHQTASGGRNFARRHATSGAHS
jgi:hypothetical protein